MATPASSAAELRRIDDAFRAPGSRPPLKAPLTAGAAPRALVAGIGGLAGGGDSAGVRVARLVRDAVPPGVRVMECADDLGGLLDAWRDLPLAILIDATRSGAPAGLLSRVEVLPGARPALTGLLALSALSDRGSGLDRVVAQGRAVGCLPKRLVIIGIEGAGPDATGRAPADVRPAVRAAAHCVLTELLRG